MRARDMANGEYVATRTPLLDQWSTAKGHTSVMDVEVLRREHPLVDAPVLFDETGLLSVQSESNWLHFGLHSRDVKQPELVATTDRNTTKVRIYSGKSPVNRWSSRTGLFDPLLGTPFLRILLTNHLACRDGVIVHAAGAVFDHRALVFPGLSTGGKSTLARCIHEARLGGSILSDERIIVRRAGRNGGKGVGFEAWGTPWMSDAQLAEDRSASLASLLFPVKAENCKAVPLSASEAMQRLVPTVSFPWYDEEIGQRVLDTCGCLAEGIPCYDLHFPMGGDVARFLVDREWGHDSGLKSGAPGEDV